MVMKFIVKLILSGTAMALLLYWYTEISLLLAALAAILFVIVAWLLGDQLILRSSTNITAAIADGVMSIIYLWIVSYALNLSLQVSEMLVISVVVTVAEWFFHRYVLKPDHLMIA
jgi:hypothetical protein